LQKTGKLKTEQSKQQKKIKIMPAYKLTAPRQFGYMPKGYTFQVASATFPTPNAQDIEKEIARLGFNKQAQSYKSAGNFKVEKIS
jgi:hypothetical protein